MLITSYFFRNGLFDLPVDFFDSVSGRTVMTGPKKKTDDISGELSRFDLHAPSQKAERKIFLFFFDDVSETEPCKLQIDSGTLISARQFFKP